MIVFPENWRDIGRQVELDEIAALISQIISEIPCDSLALSGGIDSSLLLSFMCKPHKRIWAFTIGLCENHPDIEYAKKIVAKFPCVHQEIYIPTATEIEDEKRVDDFPGDAAVRLFFRFVWEHTDRIIAGDGIDEFMCGYYGHQKDVGEKTYYDYIKRLFKEQLNPLDRNSGKVKTYLPYLDSRLISLLSQIPIFEKVDINHRKKLMISLATGRLPDEIITRRKYGFCDALNLKEE